MSFKPDHIAILSRKKIKKIKLYHPIVYFNNILISSTSASRDLVILLDDKLSLEYHLDFFLIKNKIVGLLCKLHQSFLRQYLITIYKFFIRPHLDYDDIVYDQAFKLGFH